MSAEIRRLYPEGLKDSACKRGQPCHMPSLRFAPSIRPVREDGDEDYTPSITVELDQKTTAKVIPHTFSNVEDFLSFQNHHDYILSQQD